MKQPQVIMIAGPNGAGKTSTAMTLLPNFLQVNEFVNADEIAHGLSPLNQNSMAIEAGRLMLKRIQNLIDKRKNFAFETTGAAKLHIRTLQHCRDSGYQTGLVFLYLSSAKLALERVKLRVSQGGHDIPEIDIKRRYYKGLEMLFTGYIPIVDTIEIYDNSYMRATLIAKKLAMTSPWVIQNHQLWQKIQEVENEE